MQLNGLSIIGVAGATSESAGAAFHGFDPRTNTELEPKYFSASAADVERAAQLAHAAFTVYKNTGGKNKPPFYDASPKNWMAQKKLSSSALLWRPRCPQRVSRVSWGVQLHSCVCSPIWWKKARGSKRALTPATQRDSRFPSPTCVQCFVGWGRLEYLALPISHSHFLLRAEIPRLRSRQVARLSSRRTRRIPRLRKS